MATVRPRPHADGTIAYAVLWREGGRGKQTSETFDTEHDAELLRDYLNANGQTFSLAAEAYKLSRAHGPTVAEAAERHIKGLTGIEDRTKADYRRDVRLHIVPHLGHIRANQVTREHVKDWVNKLADEGCAPKSIANYHGLLSAIMTTLAEGPENRNDNPCKGVRLPERDRRKDREKFLEVHEYELIQSFIPPQWQHVTETLSGTGARWSEATAADVADLIGDKHPYIQITKAWKRDDHNGYFIGNPKTPKAVRDISITKKLAKRLRQLADGRAPGDFLLVSPRGNPVSYHYFQRKVWTPAVKKAQAAGLRKHPKIKSLRHSHGSWLVAQGVDLTTVSRRLGHENIQTTVNIYGHVSDRSQRLAAKAMEKVLG